MNAHPPARASFVTTMLLTAAMLLSACGSAVTPSPSASTPASAAVSQHPDESPAASHEPSPSDEPPAPPTFELHDIAAVIADEPLVLRSTPGTGSDSAILDERLYPLMKVRVLEGPVTASGYEWYRVAVGSLEGWAAAGSLDGNVHTPWLAWVTNGLVAYGGDAERMGGVPQVLLVDAEGADQRQLTDLTQDALNVETARGTGNVLAVTCGTDVAPMEWSPSGGTLAFAVGGCAKSVHVIRADGTGARRLVDGLSLTWSPDGRRLAGSRNVPYMPAACADEGPWDLWMVDAAAGGGDTITRSDPCIVASSPDWSPDGRAIAFQVTDAGNLAGGTAAIWVLDLAADAERRVTTGWEPRWSPDGTRVLVQRDIDSNGADPGCGECTGTVVSVTLEGSDEISYGIGYNGAWSPDGTYVAYHRPAGSQETQEVVVVRADGSDEWVLPIPGVFRAWAPDGRHVLVSSESELWRYPLEGGDPVLLTEAAVGAVAWQPVLRPVGAGQ